MPGRPNIPNGYLGAQPKFAEFGLSMLSNPQSEINVDSNSLEVKLKFNPSNKVKVTHQLLDCDNEDKDISEFVFTQTQEDTIVFIISLPSAGFFKFQIFALPSNDDNKSLPNVLNYLINCKQAPHPCFPFPKQYAQWKDGCHLQAPLCLNKNMPLSSVNFNVHIPGANGVAVIAGGNWLHLKKQGNNWEGTVDLSPFKDSKVTLNANMVADETKYSTMLEYTL